MLTVNALEFAWPTAWNRWIPAGSGEVVANTPIAGITAFLRSVAILQRTTKWCCATKVGTEFPLD